MSDTRSRRPPAPTAVPLVPSVHVVDEDGEEDVVMHIEGVQAAPALPTGSERDPVSSVISFAFENLLSSHVMIE